MKRSPEVALVDYGSGNLRSVEKALEACGARVQLVQDPKALGQQDALVVPGVGAFGDAASNLRRTGLWDVVAGWLAEGRPYLGICLGYQLLFESSEESPGAKGFGVLPGRVVRFPSSIRKIPHMGWNELDDARGPLFGNGGGRWFYFVHSYFPELADESAGSSWCEYGVRFASSASRGSLHATQFHPEKSQEAGLALLRGFLGSLSL